MTESDTYLTTAELAKRWRMEETTLRSWRHRRIGPSFFKPSGARGKTLYHLADVEAWETRNSTAQPATAEAGA